jgi:hypothetical protein
MFYSLLFILFLQYFLISPAFTYYKSYDHAGLGKIQTAALGLTIINILLLIIFKLSFWIVLSAALFNVILFTIINQSFKHSSSILNEMNESWGPFLIKQEKKLFSIKVFGYIIIFFIIIFRYSFILKTYLSHHQGLLIYLVILFFISFISSIYYHFKKIRAIQKHFNLS